MKFENLVIPKQLFTALIAGTEYELQYGDALLLNSGETMLIGHTEDRYLSDDYVGKDGIFEVMHKGCGCCDDTVLAVAYMTFETLLKEIIGGNIKQKSKPDLELTPERAAAFSGIVNDTVRGKT